MSGLTGLLKQLLTNPLAVLMGGTGVSTAPANQVFAGPVSGSAAAPGFRAPVPADVAAALGFTPQQPQFLEANTSASDFSANGSYIQALGATFTATTNRAKLSGAFSINHQGSSGATFLSYVDLYDNTAKAQVGSGIILQVALTTTNPQGSLSPIYGVSNLTLGHSYTARLFVERNAAVGPSSYLCDLVVENF